MTKQQAVRLLAGSVIVLSAVLALSVSSWWLLLTGFVGLNFTQSVFTGFCPAETMFGLLGLKEAQCEPRRA